MAVLTNCLGNTESIEGTDDIEDIYTTKHLLFHSDENHNFLNYDRNILDYVLEIVSNISDIHSKTDFKYYIKNLGKKYNLKELISFSRLNLILRILYENKAISLISMKNVLKYSIAKKCRSMSGILEVAVMTKPDTFSCAYDCYYCPNQENMPRSYVAEGPAARRASSWNFDTVKQIHSRLTTYSINGHEIDKLEIIVLGGTWSSYSMEYRCEFTNEVYYAANTFFDIPDEEGNYRPMLSIAEEQELNTYGKCKIVGFTIETRPDEITPAEIESFLEFGVTRVQLGWQHTDNKILKKINRKCTVEDIKESNKFLRNNGFKVVSHIMPNLPGSSPAKDLVMFEGLFNDSFLFCDEMKIYPTIVTTTSEKDDVKVDTVIEKWYLDGKYVPYNNEELIEVLIYAKSIIPEFTRISRIFRDIPQGNTISGGEMPHMRQVLQTKMKERGLTCNCIRCHEVRDFIYDSSLIYYSTIHYNCCDGIEYFITANVMDPETTFNYLIGFLRLRFPDKESYNGKLPDTAIIRELHVYSKLAKTYNKSSINIDNIDTKCASSQHMGIGGNLLKLAEDFSKVYGYNRISVTSGVGVRGYYIKKGYKLENGYMIKNTDENTNENTNENVFKRIIKNSFNYVMSFLPIKNIM